MKGYYCDRCHVKLEDGPVGAFYHSTITINPSYDMPKADYVWDLCPTHGQQLLSFLYAFLRNIDA